MTALGAIAPAKLAVSPDGEVLSSQQGTMARDEDSEALHDTGSAAVVLMAALHQIAADAGQIRHAFAQSGAPMAVADVLKALRSLDLKTSLARSSFKKLSGTPLPALAVTVDGEFFVVAKVARAQVAAGGSAHEKDGDKVLLQDPLASAPIVMSRADFEKIWSGQLILVTRRAGATLSEFRFGLGWFAKSLGHYKKIMGEVLMASFFIQIFALVSPLFFQVVIDKVLVHRGLTTLDVLIIGIVTLGVFDVLLNGLRSYVMAHTTNRIDVTLGARLFDHLLGLPMGYFQSRPAGQSVARVRELENIRNFLTSSALTLTLDLFFTTVFLAVMWYYSPLMTMIVMASLPLYAGISVIVSPILRNRLEEQFQRGATNQSFLVETVTGVETVKAMAVEPQLQRRWEEQLAAYVTAGFRARVAGLWGSQSITLVNKLTMAFLLYFGAKAVLAGDITIGMLIAFNMLAGQVSQPVLRLAQLWQDFQQARISVSRLGDILNTPREAKAGPGKSALPAIEGRITLENVSFRYSPDGQKILDGLNMEIRPGECVGIMGESGCGKSTITKLIQRLYLPESGRVLIDGVDIAHIDPAWLRRQIGVVLQDNILFNRSIRENISLVDPAMPMERVMEAAKLAGAHEFISRLSHGYDTIVEERGSSLSGGQRQRIAIARALVNNPKILIFDEATSALDPETEAVIQQNMKRIIEGRTTVIIAHRETAVRECGRVVTMGNAENVQ